MKFNKFPEETFLEILEEEEEKLTLHMDYYRNNIATIQVEDIESVISIAKEHKNKKVIEYCERMKERVSNGTLNYFDFFYNLCNIIQRQRYSKNKYPMFHKIRAAFQTELETCNKYEAVFLVVRDFMYSIQSLENSRKKLKEVKQEVEEDCFFDAIGESLLDARIGNQRNYLPNWFYC